MNQELIKDMKAVIGLVNDMLALLEEYYMYSEDEAAKEIAVKQTAASKVFLAELERVDRILHNQNLNDIEAANLKKTLKEWHRALTKKKMDTEVGVHFIQR